MVEKRGEARAWLAMWGGAAVVTLLAIYRLRQFPYHLSWSAAWEGIRPLLGETLWAAIKVWTFWGWGTLVVGGLALRAEPELEQFDAILVGAGGVWTLAFLLGNLLGPIRLFNSATLWGLLAVGTAWLWRNPRRHRKLLTVSSGQKLAALAVVLLAVVPAWYLAIFPQPYIKALETASEDVQVAYNAYDALHKPLHRSEADDLLAQFFERRDDRDEAILIRARAGAGAKLADLVGPDYPLLKRTRLGGPVRSLARLSGI